MISFMFLNWYLLNKFWAIFPVSVHSSIVVIDEFGKEIDNAAVLKPNEVSISITEVGL